MKILIVKESRNHEKRVALVPKDVAFFTESGFKLYVENNAGIYSGFKNSDYRNAGAKIVFLKKNKTSLKKYLSDFDIIIRVKRPNRKREKIENNVLKKGTILIGSLDCRERNSKHIYEYMSRGIEFKSFDQYVFHKNCPMNAIKYMSIISGKVISSEIIKKFPSRLVKITLIGFGKLAKALYKNLIQNGYINISIISSNHNLKLSEKNTKVVNVDLKKNILESNLSLFKSIVCDSSVIVTSASENGKTAPILINSAIQKLMVKNSIIYDLAIPEGGNVEGSLSDRIVKRVPNNLKIINESGYPKYKPKISSLLWSRATKYFLNNLLNEKN